jgi:CpeT protein
MRFPLIPFLLLAAPLLHAQGGQRATLDALARCMLGSFSSADQARADTNYFNIELEMARIWRSRPDGVWVYVEQARADAKHKPYRQRVYQLQQVDDSTFTSTVYSLDSAEWYVGGYKLTHLLDRTAPERLVPLEGCALTLHNRNGAFVGATDGRSCRNSWGKASYATSEVIVQADRLISWDRGWNEAGEQVWGATQGGYIFVKTRDAR